MGGRKYPAAELSTELMEGQFHPVDGATAPGPTTSAAAGHPPKAQRNKDIEAIVTQSSARVQPVDTRPSQLRHTASIASSCTAPERRVLSATREECSDASVRDHVSRRRRHESFSSHRGRESRRSRE